MTARPPLVAVCGASRATPEQLRDAAEVGRLLAASGCTVVCGGLGGVMEGVAAAVKGAGGTCIGLLPGDDPDAAAGGVTVAIPTGMGEMRNALIVRSAAGVIAIGGGYGTLSEIAFALRLGRPVAALRSWTMQPPGGERIADELLHVAESAHDAVSWMLERINAKLLDHG